MSLTAPYFEKTVVVNLDKEPYLKGHLIDGKLIHVHNGNIVNKTYKNFDLYTTRFLVFINSQIGKIR